MGNLRPFQIGLLAAFFAIAIISVVALASYKGITGVGSTNPYGSSVVIWGTLDEAVFNKVLQEASRTDKSLQVVKYVEIDDRAFEDQFVNAIAEGRGPDAIVLNHEDLVTFRSKLQAIPYDTFSTRTLRDNYVDGFDIFAMQEGLYAVPLLVDPLLMYWNRDLLATAGLASPPATWENFSDAVQKLTLRDATRNILQSAVAFGEYNNVTNAKGVLLTLLQQSGSKLVTDEGQRYMVALDTAVVESGQRPLSSTLQFYVEFSNPASPLYSWNLVFQDDTTAFSGERLAFYFGYASEFSRLASQNPNLNFDATAVPQGSGATIKRVYGKFYGLALVKSSSNISGAYNALTALGSVAGTASIADSLGMVPAHRSTIVAGSPGAVRQTAFNQALIARGWLDPGRAKSNEVLRQAIEDITSGRSKVSSAASDTIKRLELSY